MIKFQHKPCDSERVTSKFELRWGTFHNGLDIGGVIPGVEGDALYAVKDGKVVISKVNGGGVNNGFGYYIVIDHGDFCTLYGHMQKLEVTVGQTVRVGEVVGHMGQTGTATGVHLHFEVREGSYNPNTFWDNDKYGKRLTAVDPLTYFLESFKVANDYKSRWSEDDIDHVKKEGVMVGYEDGSFKPTEKVTREELAAVISRILYKIKGD